VTPAHDSTAAARVPILAAIQPPAIERPRTTQQQQQHRDQTGVAEQRRPTLVGRTRASSCPAATCRTACARS